MIQAAFSRDVICLNQSESFIILSCKKGNEKMSVLYNEENGTFEKKGNQT